MSAKTAPPPPSIPTLEAQYEAARRGACDSAAAVTRVAQKRRISQSSLAAVKAPAQEPPRAPAERGAQR